MHKKILSIIFAILILQGCSTFRGLFGKKPIGNPNDPDFLNTVQELKSAYRQGDVRALDELIRVYEDTDLHVKLRIAAGKTLSQTQHPRALHAIAEMVSTTTAVDYTLLNESINMLGIFSENPKAADALLKSMHTMEERTNEVHLSLVKSLNRVRTKDQILGLLDLYEVAKSNLLEVHADELTQVKEEMKMMTESRIEEVKVEYEIRIEMLTVESNEKLAKGVLEFLLEEEELNVNNKEVSSSSNPEKDSVKLKGSLSPDFIKKQFPQQYQAQNEPPPAIQLQNIMNTLGKEGWQFSETINLPNLVFLVFIRKII